ncbi:MAG: trehalase-like domain-containing protein, partial [Gammaproteobacteria bacterium]
MPYQPIENYGIVGDMHTVALVGMNGSIDWFCFPRFDSPSVFAAILDDKKGGRFRITPTCEGITYKQFYWPETNVLVTRFLAPDGVGEIMDYMPVGLSADDQSRHQLIRRVHVVRGSMPFRMECCPAFNYARDTHVTELEDTGVCFHSAELSLGLGTSQQLKQCDNGVSAEFTLREGETQLFV